ncbi:14134_t:CDS:2, partial [Gigaspora rosea]
MPYVNLTNIVIRTSYFNPFVIINAFATFFSLEKLEIICNELQFEIIISIEDRAFKEKGLTEYEINTIE